MKITNSAEGDYRISLDAAAGVADRIAFRGWAGEVSGSRLVSIELGNRGFSQLDEWYDFLEVCSGLAGRGVRLAFAAGGAAAEALRSFGVRPIVPIA